MARYTTMLSQLASQPWERAFFPGNADLLGAARESALKVQEMTAGKIVAYGEDLLTFRHGPISAVNNHSLVCMYLSSHAYTRRYELDFIEQYYREFEKLGVRLVVVSPKEITLPRNIPTIVYSQPIQSLHQINVAVLVGQILALYAAYHRGIDVDNPAMHKKLYSRTVQGVRIYSYEMAM